MDPITLAYLVRAQLHRHTWDHPILKVADGSNDIGVIRLVLADHLVRLSLSLNLDGKVREHVWLERDTRLSLP